jgi:hypothetical protein
MGAVDSRFESAPPFRSTPLTFDADYHSVIPSTPCTRFAWERTHVSRLSNNAPVRSCRRAKRYYITSRQILE